MKTLKLAVLGSPIAHSRSPQLQQVFADCSSIPITYERIETTRQTLLPTLKRMFDESYDGFNCTMPLKTDMALLADTLTKEARILCSANTVAVRDGRMAADTTDGGGILLTVRRGLHGGGTLSGSYDGGLVKDKNVLLLGAGGAARSTALSLSLAGAKLTILNRTLRSAHALRTMLGDESVICGALTPDELTKAAGDADLVINCTSAGMSGQPEFESLAFLDALKGEALVIDAVYNPLETRLLAKARARGLSAMSGLWMLVYQGALAFEKWTGWLPDEAACQKAFDTISGDIA